MSESESTTVEVGGQTVKVTVDEYGAYAETVRSSWEKFMDAVDDAADRLCNRCVVTETGKHYDHDAVIAYNHSTNIRGTDIGDIFAELDVAYISSLDGENYLDENAEEELEDVLFGFDPVGIFIEYHEEGWE